MVTLYLLLVLLSCGTLSAERITIDPSSRSFETRPQRRERVDTFDFAGIYPELENIDINASKKKNVEFYLTGEYPALKSLTYKGSFGALTGELTGKFPNLALVNFLCTNCAMHFDLEGEWQKSCEIHIQGADEDVVLTLPKEVGVVVFTKTGVKGKVVSNEGLKKKTKLGVLNKRYENALAETSPVVLTFHIQVGDGKIVLN